MTVTSLDPAAPQPDRGPEPGGGSSRRPAFGRGWVVGVVAVLTVGMLTAGGLVARTGQDQSAPVVPSSVPAGTGRTDLAAGTIAADQAKLRANPANAATWAELGTAYVQQARISADPAYYPKAEGALTRALDLDGGNVNAMIGLGALANARHDFPTALSWGQRATAANPASATAYGVLDDAQTQLGDYSGATASVQRMLDLRPGVAAFTRASYDLEERGDLAGARHALDRALEDAAGPADVAFCRYYLGELAANAGRPAEAAGQYALGLRADPGSATLLAGQAKAEAALGQRDPAIRDYTAVVGRFPLPQFVLELGELLESYGQAAEAARQYELLATEVALYAANGVTDELTLAQFHTDHGDPVAALREAESEWQRRHSVLVADAMAWALHRNGRDGEALGYAREATRLGWHNALFSYHLGMIEAAMNDPAAARADLALALATNPDFNPLQAPVARATLIRLGGDS